MDEQVSSIYRYLLSVIICVGLVGNFVCMFSLCTRRSKKLQSSTIYLYALVCTDVAYLMSLAVDKLRWLDLPDIVNQDGACQILIYVYGASTTLSSYYIVAFTFERFAVVRHPLRRKEISVKRARLVVLAVTVMGIVANAYLPVMTQVQTFGDANGTTMTVCDINSDMYMAYTYINIADLIFSFLIPLCIILSLNIAIILIIVKANQVRQEFLRRISLPAQSFSSAPYGAPISSCITPRGQCNTLSGVSQEEAVCCLELMESWLSNAYERRTTIIVVLVSLTYFCLNSPSYFVRSYSLFVNAHDGNEDEMFRNVERTAMFLYNLQFAVNSFFYSMITQMCCVAKKNSQRRERRRQKAKRLALANRQKFEPAMENLYTMTSDCIRESDDSNQISSYV